MHFQIKHSAGSDVFSSCLFLEICISQVLKDLAASVNELRIFEK